jgi:hypothetical protein
MQPASTHPAGRAPARWNRARRAAAAALAAAFAVLLPASVTSAWIGGTILSTSGYVAAVTPVAASPAVRAAVEDAVTTIPAAACRAISRTASSACTQIPLFPAAALAGPRHAYRILVAMLVLVLVLTALALAGALAVSPRRRRTLLQLTIGGTLTVLTVMTAVFWGQSILIDRAAPRYQAVTSVIVHALTAGFFTVATWCVAAGFVITAIALLSGPPAAWPPRSEPPSASALADVAERERVGQRRHVEVATIDKLPEADGQVGGGVRRRDLQIAGPHRPAAGMSPGQGGICRLAGGQMDELAAGVVRPEGVAPVGDRRQDPVAGVQ